MVLGCSLPLAAQSRRAGGGEITSGTYVIAPLDLVSLRLLVADEIQFETGVKVSRDGTVLLPHLGSVNLAGKTVDEATDFITQAYNTDFYVNPHVTLTVAPQDYSRVLVTGYVNAPGEVPIPAESELYLLEAIALAGGYNAQLASRDRVEIIRSKKDGEQERIVVDTTKITARDYPLKNGDSIVVPRRVW